MVATSRRRAALTAVLALAAACTDEWGDIYDDRDHDGDSFFTRVQWDAIRSHCGVPDVPPEPSNAYSDDPKAALLGQALFFDAGYAPPDPVGQPHACASCHAPETWFIRAETHADIEPYNITSVVNVAHNEFHTWTGKRDSLWSLALVPAEGFLATTRLRIAHHIAENYREQYACVFGDADVASFFNNRSAFPSGVDADAMEFDALGSADQAVVNRIFANYGKAMAAYMRKIVTGPSRFDRYVGCVPPDNGAQSTDFGDAEKRGLALFVGGRANCSSCHAGRLFSDDAFHDIALPVGGDSRYEGIDELDNEFRLTGPYSDDPEGAPGVYPRTEEDRGAFRTASLRNIAMTGKYMHDGQFATLREVIEHYNEPPEAEDGRRDRELWPLDLTTGEMADLEAFLGTLTGDPVPSAVGRRLSPAQVDAICDG